VAGAFGADEGLARAKVWKCRAAALPDEVDAINIRPEPKPFRDVAREAGAEITRASAHNERIDLVARNGCVFEGARGCFEREQWRVFRKAGMQCVGIDPQTLSDRIDGKMTALDSILREQNLAQQRA
jgi:hypothetical protein